MKKIFCILTLALVFSACNDWLDVNPELEMREKEAFATEQGFQDLLIGAYIRMATSSLYGYNTTVMLPEMIAQHWTMWAETTPGDLMTQLMGFDYTSTESKAFLEATWLQYYKTISNLNSLLAEIDARKGLFTDGNYELIKGEALGLRAFLHFEILRFWGAVPARIKLTDKVIPYVTSITKNPDELLAASYQDVLGKIIDELNQAETLLADDPITKYNAYRLMHPEYQGTSAAQTDYPANDFHVYRQVRFNYYAVKAAKARYYLFISHIPGMGDQRAKAAQYAQEVIDAKDAKGILQFTLGTESEAGNGQLTFPREQIFAASNSLATSTLTSILFSHRTAYTQDPPKIATAYESTVHPFDIRYRDKRLWEDKIVPLSTHNFNYFKKYNDTETTAVTDMPLIRLAEMYFIAIECGRTDLFRTYRIARNLDSSIDDTLVDDDAVRARLEQEYRKEFYGEGQMYFFYKRLGYTRFTWPSAKSFEPGDLELPIPESQLLFEL